MENTSAGRTNDPGRHSYLIENADPMSASDLVDLHALADALRAEPDVAVTAIKELNVSRGAGETLKIVTLVVEMPDERAERLRREFGGRLTVERNLDLTPF